MNNERTTTIIDYTVTSCPRCNEAHFFKLKGLVQQKTEESVPLFGGTGEVEGTGRKREILFACPNTKKKFSYQVPEPKGVELIGLASEADIAMVINVASASSPSKSEFEEWANKSRDTALDFCKTMLSASTGSIPVYFAVLKYIGFEKIGSTTLSQFAILPSVLVLAAAILYVLALRPGYESVAPSDFNAFRKRRFERLNQFIIWGTAIFIGAVGLAIVMLFYTLSLD